VTHNVKFGDLSDSTVARHIGIRFEQTRFWTVLHGPIKLKDTFCLFSKFDSVASLMTTCRGP
jgi:hypothetical protein